MEGTNISDELNSKLKELKNEISQMRKKGINVKIAEMKIMNIPSKIRIAEITNEKESNMKVEQLLDDVEKEIESTKIENGIKIEKKNVEINIEGLEEELSGAIENKKEIDREELRNELRGELNKEQKKGEDEKEARKKEYPEEQIRELINKAGKHIEAKEKQEADTYYAKIMQAYKGLPKELKEKFLKDCLEIRNKLIEL
ncbi:MAG: hypothetical protein KAK00_00750 [Nanoarchaeota archaeon]|nr:hypothetical protein [Nanoarchaeota archaeon]